MDGDPIDLGVGAEARSETGLSDVSSHISRPKWRRLLRAAASAIAKRIHDSGSKTNIASMKLEATFYHADATGGGTEYDVHNCLKSLLEELQLNDADTGTILIGTHHFLQAQDLPISSKTWRGLMVSSLLASVQVCLRDNAPPVKERIYRAVVHWWPRAKAEEALSVFTSREAHKAACLAPSVRASSYFDLREKGLQMSPSVDSNNTAVISDSGYAPGVAPRPHGFGSSRDRSQLSRSDLNISLGSADSFLLSEDSGFVVSEASV